MLFIRGPVYKQEEDSMGSPSGDMLCAHLAEAAAHFHISNSTASTENQHLPASETKDKYGKMGTRGGHCIRLNVL